MKYLLLFLCSCSGDAFTVIPLAQILPDAAQSEPETGTDAPVSPPDADASPDSGSDSAAPDASPDAAFTCKDPNDVAFQGRCFYLDGSKGVCDQGYSLGSNVDLGKVLAQDPNAWQGKTYRHTTADNGCVLTKDLTENYGSLDPLAGPFTAGEPVWNGSSCNGAMNMQPKQLTLCVSP